MTPAPKAECPKQTSTIIFKPELKTTIESQNKQFTDYTINFLNSGGTIESIRARYQYSDEIIQYQDLTGDTVKELIIAYGIWFDFFGCSEGEYKLLNTFTTDSAQGSKIIGIVDINQNGLLELIGYYHGCWGWKCPSIEVYEWNGSEFSSRISAHSECWQPMPAPLEVEIEDLDQNGTQEIVLYHNGKPWPSGFGYPYRAVLRVCGWNGENIDVLSSEYVQPVYRYQALQDADAATRAGNFPKALGLYTRVISDDTLEWFTTERNNYDFWLYWSEYSSSSGNPTPTASPSLQPNPSEYSRLAAYAYFRIMLLYLVQGQESKGNATYDILQQKFSRDPYAKPYIEMAMEFWNAYYSTGNVYSGCEMAIQVAIDHPEILESLGNDYHGSQSHNYVPADVCPFR